MHATRARTGRRRLPWWLSSAVFLVATSLTGVRYLAAQAGATTPLTKVRTELNDALLILHNQKMSAQERRRALRDLAERDLDFQSMAREALGDHWVETPSSERDEFVKLFTAFIEEIYLAQIQDYVELNITVGAERLPSPGHAEVDGTVRQPHEEVMPITFRLEKHGDDWIVYDIDVEDVSMVHNYRTQFARVIDRQGMPQLLSDLRVKQKKLAALVGEP